MQVYDVKTLFLGKLSLAAIPFDNPITLGAFSFMLCGLITVALIITFLHKWKYLWREWFTSVDHKKIGVMYILVGLVMGVRGFADGVLMRSQLLFSYGHSHGYIHANHYDQIFSGHGVIMIFFVAMPFIIGLINIAVPLQIGARDVAFPFLNSVSLGLFVAGAVLVNISLGIGEFAKTGWIAYPPLSEISYSPGVGVDYYIWSLEIAGTGTLLTGINFLVTILKLRAPGMKLMHLPLFTWTALGTNLLIIGAFPILTVDLALLALDRYLGMHFFTNTGGGNMMMYVNWFWAWGHPEVYILILPVFGVFSEVVTNFSGRKLFGYTSMVYSTMAITLISYLVWLHHFFTMGAGGNVNAFFGIMTSLIAIPTGVKIFNWLFTMYHGKIRFKIPMLWTLAFLCTFVIGGMTGVMLAIPPADFVLHNSEFLIAHFHTTIIAGTIFGFFAGYTYWFPKAFGFTLNELLGKLGLTFFVIGFYLTFMPLFILGFMGMTRRINHYDNPAWKIPILIAAIGVVIIGIGMFFLILQLIMSFIQRKQHKDLSGDPWDARTLEWSVASPPPSYNFAVLPLVHGRDEFWEKKQKGSAYEQPSNYHDILMLNNTPAGIFIGIFSLLFGFAMVWYIWWLACFSFSALIITIILRTSHDKVYHYISAEKIQETEERFINTIENLRKVHA